jgi:uncharacterized membrane protein YeaQ/YmgE (transglycosylase-associated protein family)
MSGGIVMITIIWFIIIGLIAGALARLLVPGRDPMGIIATILLGIIGSFVGGTLWALVDKDPGFTLRSASWLGSIIGAIIVLLIWRAVRSRRVA